MTFLHPHKIAHLILCALLLTACDHSNSESVPEFQSEMENFLTYGIQNTPYAALIRNISSSVESLPDDDTSDDFALVRWSFTAEVLETYRGPSDKTIHYTVDAEKGEAPNFGDGPFIILLCESKDGYYWPGIGFNFPTGERQEKISRSLGKKVDKKQRTFVECGE